MTSSLLRPFWLFCAALALAWCWLLPNHTMPWLAFHSDAWAAIVLSFVSAYVLWKAPSALQWHGLTLLTAALMMMVTLQFATGLISSSGVAWINLAYLLGVLLVLLVGSTWERASPLQCADLLFIAVVVGAIGSVGLQIHQWLNLEAIGPWTMRSTENRYFANLGQSNQLASLLLLGVLGCAWLHWRGWLQRYIAVLLVMCLLFGLALTDSRTGRLNVVLIVAALFAWRKLPGMGRLPLVSLTLMLFYAACVLTLPTLNELLGARGVPTELRPMTDHARIKLWSTLLEASTLQPWFGFGWGQVSHAQFFMRIDQMMDQSTLQQAHNLMLDLMLWNGIPIGLAVTALLGGWAWRAMRHVANVAQALMMLFLAVLTVHAMLEFPLQYAYFLLPAGLMLGALNTTLGFRVYFETARWSGMLVMLVAGTALTATVRDYMRVETSFYGLRFEQRNIQTSIPPTPPDVWVLTQWYDVIRFARSDPAQTHTTEDIAWASNLVRTTPSGLGMYKLAAMLAFAGRHKEAQHWQDILCKVNDPVVCKILKERWDSASKKYPPMAAVAWPQDPPAK